MKAGCQRTGATSTELAIRTVVRDAEARSDRQQQQGPRRPTPRVMYQRDLRVTSAAVSSALIDSLFFRRPACNGDDGAVAPHRRGRATDCRPARRSSCSPSTIAAVLAATFASMPRRRHDVSRSAIGVGAGAPVRGSRDVVRLTAIGSPATHGRLARVSRGRLLEMGHDRPGAQERCGVVVADADRASRRREQQARRRRRRHRVRRARGSGFLR